MNLDVKRGRFIGVLKADTHSRVNNLRGVCVKRLLFLEIVNTEWVVGNQCRCNVWSFIGQVIIEIEL